MKKIGLLLLLFFVAGQAPASESSSWRRGQGRAFADPFLGVGARVIDYAFPK